MEASEWAICLRQVFWACSCIVMECRHACINSLAAEFSHDLSSSCSRRVLFLALSCSVQLLSLPHLLFWLEYVAEIVLSFHPIRWHDRIEKKRRRKKEEWFFFLSMAAWLPSSYHFVGARLRRWCCAPIPVHRYSFRQPRKDDRLSQSHQVLVQQQTGLELRTLRSQASHPFHSAQTRLGRMVEVLYVLQSHG